MQRAARKRHGGSDGQGLATVAVIGYTNAVGVLNLIILGPHSYYARHLNKICLLFFIFLFFYFDMFLLYFGNQGKSTLVSALSDSDLYSDARYFNSLVEYIIQIYFPYLT